MTIPFFLAALGAEIAGTIAGFGSSTIFLPIALLFIDFKSALVLVAWFHVFGNLSRFGFFRRGFDKKLFLQFGIPSVIATIVGALMVTLIRQTILKGMLGLFLVVFSLMSLLHASIRLRRTTLNISLGGVTSGFFAGLIGTGGAIRGAFLTVLGIPKERFLATTAIVAIAVDLTRIPLYLSQGFLHREFYGSLPILMILALIGSWIGKLVVVRVNERAFRIVVLIALFMIGVKFLFDWMAAPL